MIRKFVLIFCFLLLFPIVCFADSVPRFPMNNNQLIDFARSYVSKIPIDEHYVFYLYGEYDYRLVHGKNIMLSGTNFLCSNCERVDFIYNPSYGYSLAAAPTDGYDIGSSVAYYPAYYSFSTGSFNGSVSAGSYLVYSDLGDYPNLYGDDYAIQLSILFVLSIFVFMYILRCVWAKCARVSG